MWKETPLSLLQRTCDHYSPSSLYPFVFSFSFAHFIGQRLYWNSQREAAKAVKNVLKCLAGWQPSQAWRVLLTWHFSASTEMQAAGVKRLRAPHHQEWTLRSNCLPKVGPRELYQLRLRKGMRKQLPAHH